MLFPTLLLLASCSSGPVPIKTLDLDPGAQEKCAAFVDALPRTLTDEDPRETKPAKALGAAYGDPAIVVTCGVALPADVDKDSICEVANGVGWSAPPEQYDDQDVDVTFYALTFDPIVEMRLPADYRPNGLAAALADLAAPITEHLEPVGECF